MSLKLNVTKLNVTKLNVTKLNVSLSLEHLAVLIKMDTINGFMEKMISQSVTLVDWSGRMVLELSGLDTREALLL